MASRYRCVRVSKRQPSSATSPCDEMLTLLPAMRVPCSHFAAGLLRPTAKRVACWSGTSRGRCFEDLHGLSQEPLPEGAGVEQLRPIAFRATRKISSSPTGSERCCQLVSSRANRLKSRSTAAPYFVGTEMGPRMSERHPWLSLKVHARTEMC